MIEPKHVDSLAEDISMSIESLKDNLNSISSSISDTNHYTGLVSDSIDELTTELNNTNELLKLLINEISNITIAIHKSVNNTI
jgi:methyl-accepting chemotaxis protein